MGVAPPDAARHGPLLLADSCAFKICISPGFEILALLTSVYDLGLHRVFAMHGIFFTYLFAQPLFIHPSGRTFADHPHISCFVQNGRSEAEELLLSHYVICNDTHETLRFGQVDTDENVLLASLHSHQYSWRSHKSPQVRHTATHTHTHSSTDPGALI